MSLTEDTLQSFDHRSRESLIEEIMALRWQRTGVYIEMIKTAATLEERASNLREIHNRLIRSAKDWSEV